MDITIEPARLDDIESMVRLKRSVSLETYRPVGDYIKFQDWWTRCASQEYFEARMTFDPEAYIFLVARAQGGVYGVSSDFVGMSSVSKREGDLALFGDMYCVTPRAGIGSKLMKARIEIARSWGCTTAHANCYQLNEPAQAFLKKHGFVKVDEYMQPSFLTPVDVMELTL